MSYIEKEKLIKADMASIENRVRHAFNQGYDLGFKDGKEKAKPLEQEPQIRPKGHWIEHETNFTHLRECSYCKCYFDWMMPRNSYCPNCGADMRKVEE